MLNPNEPVFFVLMTLFVSVVWALIDLWEERREFKKWLKEKGWKSEIHSFRTFRGFKHEK